MNRMLMASIVTLALLTNGANAQAKQPDKQPKAQLKVNGESSWEAAYEKARQQWLAVLGGVK
ncbi:MAG: hypothetical protein R3F02_18545 [Thiolinea sp.]